MATVGMARKAEMELLGNLARKLSEARVMRMASVGSSRFQFKGTDMQLEV